MGFSTAVQYQFDKALTYASVQGNVTVCRIDVANACFDAALNVTWTGFGNFDTSNGTAHVRYGSSNFISQNLATVRAATATGTVSQGTTNYTPTPSFIAVMSWSVFHDISAP